MPLPGPRTPAAHLRVLRHLTRFPADALATMRPRYGPVFGVGFGPLRYVAMLGPEANRFILADHADRFRWRDAMAILIPVDGDTAMVVSDGEDHRRRRRAAQPAFAAKHIHAALSLMIEEFTRELTSWPLDQPVDALVALRRPINRVTLRWLFGDRLDRADEFATTLDVTIGFVNQPPWRQVKLDLPGTRWRAALRARAGSDRIVHEEIGRRRRAGVVTEHRDVLDTLLAAREEDGSPSLNDQEIRDQLISLIAASYDTIGSAAAWALHALLSDPSLWHDLSDEVDAVVGGDDLRVEHLSRLPLLDAVVNETLRLWPPTSVSGRRAVEGFEFADQWVPAGSMVLYSPYVTHRMPELWPQADTFLPQRWQGLEIDHYTFLPFGGGLRRCIGFVFALQQLKTLLVTVVRSVELSPAYTDLTPVGVPALHPAEGLPVRVVRRRHHPSEVAIHG